MGGYVFVTRADLTRLACDAILLPTDARVSIVPQWFVHLPWLKELDASGQLRALIPADWDDHHVRTVQLPAQVSEIAAVWLTNVGGYEGRDVSWYVAGATTFLRNGAASAARSAPKHGRAKPLFALPLVGS